MEEDYIDNPDNTDTTDTTDSDTRKITLREDESDTGNGDSYGDGYSGGYSGGNNNNDTGIEIESSVGSINSMSGGYPSSIYSDHSTQQLYNDFVLIPKNNPIREESNDTSSTNSIISVVSRSLSSSYQTLRQNIDYFASSI